MQKPEARSQEPVVKAQNTRAPVFMLASGFWLLASLPGCTYNSGSPEPQTLRDKQDQAVRDPINYKPDNENTQPYDISGGGINNLDKGALKKDLHDVFDP